MAKWSLEFQVFRGLSACVMNRQGRSGSRFQGLCMPKLA